jgi:hypothetical protein
MRTGSDAAVALVQTALGTNQPDDTPTTSEDDT